MYIAVAALLFLSLVTGSRPAAAQSLFQSLFGWGGGLQQSRTVIPPSSYRSVPIYQYSRSDGDDSGYDEPRQSASGRLRAVCVRTCDGYYWPVADRITRGKLYKASDACKATCDTEARLFYHDRDEADPAAMTDLAGRRYDQLEAAFLYRKKLVEGCTCRPPPWAMTERMRHAEYKLAAIRAEVERRQREEAAAQRQAARRPVEMAAPSANPVRATARGALVEQLAAAPNSSRASHDVWGGEQVGTQPAEDHSVPGGVGPGLAEEPSTALVPVEPAASSPARVRMEDASRHRRVYRGDRQARFGVQQRSRHQPVGFSSFGGGNKFVWPGDAR
ncbi:MAG: DUF2865 domain-containing protein [Hyphomicrobiaceae bacterium]